MQNLLVALAISVSTLLSAGFASQASAQGTKRALLIGINEYQNLSDLGGALNDVHTMQRILTTQLGFPDQQVRLLTDSAATREGILAALEDLVERTGPEDTVYIHYSGHGSQAPDMNGDEEDGVDETLVPHDGRTDGVPDITDDELNLKLARLSARHAVIVLDSCHSGTATRGGVHVQSRRVPADERTALYQATSPATRAVVPLAQERYVLLTGAASNQEALDAPIDGTQYGLFSYALSRSLTSAGPNASPLELMTGVERELERVKAQLGLSKLPEPQLEAPPELFDKPMFPSAEADEVARLPWLAVRPGQAPGVVTLREASSLGAQRGSLWAIYPPGELEFVPGAALAEASVTELAGDDATARLEPANAEIRADSRAVALAPPDSPAVLAVRWLAVPAARRAPLELAIRNRFAGVVFVGEDEFARFVLELEGDRCDVYGADGRTLRESFDATSDATLGAALGSLFERSLSMMELLALDNPLSALRLELRAGPEQEQNAGAEQAQRGFQIVSATAPPRYRIRRGDAPRTMENSLVLRVRASEPCFLTLVDLDSEGNLLVMFPNPLSEQAGYYRNGRIPGDEQVRIPDSLEQSNQAGFHLDYAPPAGIDTIRGFCTSTSESADALRRYIGSAMTGTRRASAAAATRGSVHELLAGTLRRELSSFASRGLSLVPAVSVADTPSETDAALDEPAVAAVDEPAVAAVEDPSPAAVDEPAVAAVAMGSSGSDWTATSLTLEVEE